MDNTPLFWILMIGIPTFIIGLGILAIYFSEKSKES